MSIQLSRRDFMKCSAVAVLAAASGTLLTGCSGGVGGGSIAPNTMITTSDGLSVKMNTFSRPTIGNIGTPDYNSVITLGDKVELFEISFDLTNNGKQPIAVVDPVNVALDDLATAVFQCHINKSPDPLVKYLQDKSFNVRTDKGEKVGCVHFFERDWHENLTSLEPGKKIEVHLLCVAPAGWKKLNITYNKLGLNFVQSRN